MKKRHFIVISMIVLITVLSGCVNGFDLDIRYLVPTVMGSISVEPEVSEIITFEPLWMSYSFANNRNVARPTNGAFVDTIHQFYTQHVRDNATEYQGWFDEEGFPIDIEISNHAREILIQGFRDDTLSQVKPFNEDFFVEVLSNIYFYFARLYDFQNYLGIYLIVDSDKSHIFVADISGIAYGLIADMLGIEILQLFETDILQISETESIIYLSKFWFAHTLLHELGHALGLGESLSDLKAESFLGTYSRVQLSYMMDLDWIRGNRAEIEFVYNSSFDRALLNLVGSERFWTAAYTSNEIYGELWDKYLHNAISHDELQMIRGLIFDVWQERSELGEQFENLTGGVSLNWVSRQITGYFKYLTEQEQYPPPLVGEAGEDEFARFRRWINILADFAEYHEITPQRSVFDEIIFLHHYRYNTNPD